MGFDRPQKIKANAQGGLLAAPAWTSFMTEAYRRKPASPDWPVPAAIVARTVDESTNMLATQYCPKDLVAVEYYLPGTEPIQPCSVHTGPGIVPDTGAVPGQTPLAPASRDTSRRPDTLRVRRPPRDSIPE